MIRTVLAIGLLCAVGFAYGWFATQVIDFGVAIAGRRLRALKDARDPYPPEAADAPDDPVEAAYVSAGDTLGFGVDRSTEAFDEVLTTIGPPPGWPVRKSLDTELDDLVGRYRRGEDITAGAPREAC